MDLRALISGNEFLSGGLILGALGTAAVLAKQYLFKGLHWLWRRFVVTVEIRNNESPFYWIVVWLAQQPYAKRARKLTVSVADEQDNSPAPVSPNSQGEIKRPTILFSPAVGNHLLVYRGRPLWIERERKEPGKDSWSKERESFNVTMFGRSQEAVRTLLTDAFDAYASVVQRRVRVFMSSTTYWIPQGFVRPRSLESVILPGNEKETLVADLRRFLSSEPWYHEMGIPYRRGYLLHGVPGSGKSSLVAAVAGAVGLHLYVVNLSALSDSGLQELLQNVSVPRAIILFEDIDCAQAANRRNGDDADEDYRGGVTVSGLLNALDGVASRDGYVTMMTTNHRELLDPALTRPGRIDMEIPFHHATVDQARALYARFYGERRHPLIFGHFETSMAALQEHFLRHREDPVAGADLRRLMAESAGLKVVGDA